ncbi:MAG TPA: phosphotransferase [Gammaproteobacteria bacterium]|nr:phosphotransferase [Gammaproteobacteria bacterium]
MSVSALKTWLQQVCTFSIDSLEEIPGDASFRRYFRLKSDQQTFIVMDASQQRDCFEPFAAITKALLGLGVTTPKVLALDEEKAYMLISDFGSRICLNELNSSNADLLYKNALDVLAVMQACQEISDWHIPRFDQGFMQRELDEFKLWFLERYLQRTLSYEEQQMLAETCHLLTSAAASQPQVFIHRDYHSANLMVLDDSQIGVLDFQDACFGPVTYDLVSLLRDCYIDWPDEKVKQWVFYYYEKLQEQRQLGNTTFTEFMKWFDWMGMQRHMKALFIFVRKYLRDNTDRYLKHLPRTFNYLKNQSSRYPEFQAFYCFLESLGEISSVAPLALAGEG